MTVTTDTPPQRASHGRATSGATTVVPTQLVSQRATNAPLVTVKASPDPREMRSLTVAFHS